MNSNEILELAQTIWPKIDLNTSSVMNADADVVKIAHVPGENIEYTMREHEIEGKGILVADYSETIDLLMFKEFIKEEE